MRIINVIGYQSSQRDGILYAVVYTVQALRKGGMNAPTYQVEREDAEAVVAVLEKHGGSGRFEAEVQTQIFGGKNYDSIWGLRFQRPLEAADFPLLAISRRSADTKQRGKDNEG